MSDLHYLSTDSMGVAEHQGEEQRATATADATDSFADAELGVMGRLGTVN